MALRGRLLYQADYGVQNLNSDLTVRRITSRTSRLQQNAGSCPSAHVGKARPDVEKAASAGLGCLDGINFWLTFLIQS
jgi:hypothetical protein